VSQAASKKTSTGDIKRTAPGAAGYNACTPLLDCPAGRMGLAGYTRTALGQDEMHSVPDINLPEGDDNVGWVRLWRNADGAWQTELCYC